MIRKNQIRRIISFFVLLCLGYATSILGIENYTLKSLFELKTGQGIDKFLLAFASAPFAPGIKIPLCPLGTHILVDNSGNFYLLKERTNIVKIDTRGEVIGEIRGTKPFTVPMEMRLDGVDNLYVNFRHETNNADEFMYRVAEFDSKGNLLHWIGDEEGYKCIYFGVTINGIVSIQSCEHAAVRNQFKRYNKDGSIMGSFVHIGSTDKDTSDAEGTYIIPIGHMLAVGIDNNAYVINNFDFTVKKYNDYTRLTTTEGIEPVAERTVFPWMQIGSKYDFQGFDINNKMYFYYSPDGRIEKRVELSKDSYVDVLDLSRPLKLEAFRYDFDKDQYDTLICETIIQEEGIYATRWPLRNSLCELFEVVIFFNDPPKAAPQDHVKFYKWEKIK